MEYITRRFWIDTAERAIKTIAQTAVAVLGAEAVNVFAVDWGAVAAVSLGAGFVSVLTSIGSSRTGSRASASLLE